MRQYVGLDRPILLAYLGLVGAGCRSTGGAVVPAPLKVVTQAQVNEWVASTIPAEHQRHRFKWLFQDERGSAGGRGSARTAPPDSLRFDVAGPFGSGAASAVVVGEQPVWMEPPDAIARLVPNYPLMWAMFGIARKPSAAVELRGMSKGPVTAWQYAGASDTIEYVRTAGNPGRLVAQVHRAGELIGRAETTLGPNGTPLKARLSVPSGPARLDLTFLSTAQDSFAPEIWLPHKP